jgi:exopolysaccharide biosynthesis WecB/TagA/CpsF family protein
MENSHTSRTMLIDGVPVHLVDAGDALAAIAAAGRHETVKPLGVVSVNLDHIHHFGAAHGTARRAPGFVDHHEVEWLDLIDGAPIAAQARRLTGDDYPKLSGSDLIAPILDDAARTGRSIGVLGGQDAVAAPLARQLAERWPDVRLAGHWTPGREVVADRSRSLALATEIQDSGADILLVCLGKPRQERWINEYGRQTGAGVLLAFGAVVDFLAGRVSRAPGWVSQAGVEWAWRLALEPRRLARRYLVDGPPAYLAVRRSSRLVDSPATGRSGP